MTLIRIGLVREGKVPPDKRVPLTPNQCAEVMSKFPSTEVVVQKSAIRAFKDEEYIEKGILVKEDLSDCDILMGVKEVPTKDLIPNKRYLFFSHTYKKQSYNRLLLQTILEKKIQLIDYELLKCKNGNRIIGFGRYAGIVGCYNAFRTYGLKHQTYNLKAANACFDRKEMEAELAKVTLPSDFKVVLTGHGRVGHGALEILRLLPIGEVSPKDFLANDFKKPVFTQLSLLDYFKRKNGKVFDKSEFYQHPEEFEAGFSPYSKVANMYISGHFWRRENPLILTKEDLAHPYNKLSVVADISCDVDGPIACTIRSSTIANPIFGYNPQSGLEDDYAKEGVIAVMAVDNLPCELPRDASKDFGKTLIDAVIPLLVEEDTDKVIERASETNLEGELMPDFNYLTDYVYSNEKINQH